MIFFNQFAPNDLPVPPCFYGYLWFFSVRIPDSSYFMAV